MVGVIHASTPIDAVQRFISRIDLGLLPQIIDTVIFVKDGYIQDIMGVKMTVKIPTGFRDDGLARPVVEVFSFFAMHQILYEIYTFGENTIVSPVSTRGYRKNKTRRKDRKSQRQWNESPSIDNNGNLAPVEGIRNTKRQIEIYFPKTLASENVILTTDTGKQLMSGSVSSKANIRLSKKSSVGRELNRYIKKGGRLYFSRS
jgi:predicted PilT family ATPase